MGLHSNKTKKKSDTIKALKANKLSLSPNRKPLIQSSLKHMGKKTIFLKFLRS